jgi:hypothetical protein
VFAPKVAKPHPKPAEISTRKPVHHRSTFAIGNQATLRYFSHRLSNLPAKEPAERHEQEAVTENMTAREPPRGAAWDFSKIPVFPPERAARPHPLSVRSAQPGLIQPKLAIGPVNDPLEREADAVADRVMRISNPALSISTAPEEISRKCADCEKDDEENQLQTKPAGTARPVGEAPPIVREVLRSPGQPLDAETRTFFEPRFGHDFRQVRIHTDHHAGTSALSVGALAYAVGPHIAFAPGQYKPASKSGLHLLAHELVHVAQQTRGEGSLRSGYAHEQEAEALAAPLTAGQSIPGAAITPAAPSLARADGAYISPYTEDLAREMYARMVAFRAEQGATGGFVENRFVIAVAAVFDEQGKRIGWFERMNVPGGPHAETLIDAEVRQLSASGRRVGYTVLMVDQDPCMEICTPLLKTWRGDPLTGSLRVVTPWRQKARDPTDFVSARSANRQLRTQETVHVEPKAPPPNREAFLATRGEVSRVRLPLYREPPKPPPGPVGAGSAGPSVASSVAGREESEVVKAATKALGSTAARRLTQAEEKQLWEAAAESFTRLATGATARRLAQASTPVIGAAFAAPDIYRGGQDIAHGNIVLGAGTIGVALVDIASQGLHLTDEFTVGGGTALAMTIQAWCTAMQMGFEMSRVGVRAQELQAYIQAHQGGLPPRDQLMGYYGLNDEDVLILENDLRKANTVTTADVIARVQALIADIDTATNQRSDADPAAVARERARLGHLLTALQAYDAAEKQRAAQEQAAAAERARQAKLDQAIRTQQAAAHPTQAQKAAAASALLPGPGTPIPDRQTADFGPFLSPRQPQSLSGTTIENAEVVATAFGRERDRLLQRYTQLESVHFPDDQVKAFQVVVATYVKNLDTMIGQFLTKGSAEWPGVKEMRRLRDAADNEDRSKLMR